MPLARSISQLHIPHFSLTLDLQTSIPPSLQNIQGACAVPPARSIFHSTYPTIHKPQTNSPIEVQGMIAHTPSYTEEVLESCGEAVDRRWVS